jgi:hypothetical protein
MKLMLDTERQRRIDGSTKTAMATYSNDALRVPASLMDTWRPLHGFDLTTEQFEAATAHGEALMRGPRAASAHYDAVLGPLGNQAASEVRDSAEHMKHQFAGGGGRVGLRQPQRLPGDIPITGGDTRWRGPA